MIKLHFWKFCTQWTESKNYKNTGILRKQNDQILQFRPYNNIFSFKSNIMLFPVFFKTKWFQMLRKASEIKRFLPNTPEAIWTSKAQLSELHGRCQFNDKQLLLASVFVNIWQSRAKNNQLLCCTDNKPTSASQGHKNSGSNCLPDVFIFYVQLTAFL